MIKTLLVANRGEIARRVMRTARKMGMRCVAVYSEADAGAPHVREADEAILLGPAPAGESYLRADRIIDAALVTGADAIHPGYGFLSENAEFAEACAKNNIVFVGPSPEAIRAMGLKDRAKALMEEAGVPVTPGYHGENQDPELLADAAKTIGYPVLIKAVAGGGGKGMRKVERAEDFIAALYSCRREASKSFGDDRVLIEKFIANPRHIEVQVFGDARGRVVHMFERDCSLQRRHQKVIEEAPAPGMTPAVRAAMCSAAVNAARAVNYVGAGTVEFIVDGSGPLREDGFFFMEMNTRLQVEHPVTEMITGLDLVELQLKIAAGGSVPEQDAIHIKGHAIEARLYAEDPASGFLPSTGVLKQFSLPHGSAFGLPPANSAIDMRVDAAVEPGGEVTVHYDPMIAKLIAWSGETREHAIDRLVDSIDLECWAHPVRTNAGFLRACLDHPDFRAARLDTGFIDRNIDTLVTPHTLDVQKACAGAVALLTVGQDEAAVRDPWAGRSGFRLNAEPVLAVRLETGGETFGVSLKKTGAADWCVSVDGKDTVFNDMELHGTPHDGSLDFRIGDEWGTALYSCPASDPGTIRVSFRGELIVVTSCHPDALADAAEAGDVVKAPMPGKVLAVNVKAGDTVAKGQALVVLEAMKMEHALTAPRDGVIAEVSVTAGGQVADGDVLVTLAEDESEAA